VYAGWTFFFSCFVSIVVVFFGQQTHRVSYALDHSVSKCWRRENHRKWIQGFRLHAQPRFG
jgi:hypothetical protein